MGAGGPAGAAGGRGDAGGVAAGVSEDCTAAASGAATGEGSTWERERRRARFSKGIGGSRVSANPEEGMAQRLGRSHTYSGRKKVQSVTTNDGMANNQCKTVYDV